MKLQRRVLGYLAVAAISSCALTVAVAVVLVRNRISAQRTTALEAQADALAGAGGAPGALGPGQHVYRFGSRGPVRVTPARAVAVLAAIHSGGNAQGAVTVDGRSLLFAARLTAAGRVVVLRSGAVAFAEWRPFLGSLVLAGIGGALLAVLLSYLLARRLTAPIGRLSAATRRVAAGEPDVEVPIDGDDELAQLGRAFNAMSSDLAQARESQRQFLESVSHELKTPLTSIRGYAEALEDGAVSSSEAARVLAAEADRLERLLADLIDLARFGRAGFSVRRTPVDLRALGQEAVRRHRPQALELEVELRISEAGSAPALGDEDRLLQVLANLVENALRLTPAGGSVLVSAAPGQIVVRDTGPGLAPEDVPRAFERFYLHDRYRSARPVGSGLGLAIVEELVRAMGGTVQATSPADGGTEFRVRLPTPARSAQTDALRPSA